MKNVGNPQEFQPDWRTVSLLGFTAGELMPLRGMLNRTGMTIRDLRRVVLEREMEIARKRTTTLEAEYTKLMQEAR